QWAQMLGMRTEKLNGIEAEILSALKFGTFIEVEEFESVRRVFEQRIAVTVMTKIFAKKVQ
ncbi:MAG: hypothetical protein EZS28_021389, partial [Streblomastix strix]